jgi:hypothetical protein
MKDDIIQRLHHRPNEDDEMSIFSADLMHEAAAEIERLRAALSGLKRPHLSCEDCWYSCPKSEDGCCNDSIPKDECTCGADAHNARIDAALAVEQTVRKED